MKDIDFDELDRAVNSLMSNVPRTQPVKDDNVKTLTLSPEPTLSAAPVSPLNQPSVAAPAAEAIQPVVNDEANDIQGAAPLANRRGGRFMDVVHPSSDMKKPTSPQGISRQGLTIEPRPGMPQSPQTADMTLVQPEESIAPEPEAPAILASSEEQQASESTEWPDPLEISSPQPETTADSEAPASPEPMQFTATSEQLAPLTSPFLADAKVEKRPLGGAPSAFEPEKVEEPDHSPVLGVLSQEAPANDNADNQLPPDPTDIEMPLPEELSGDLMAIESDANPLNQDTEPATAKTEVAAVSAGKREATVAVRSQPLAGPSSITQQYKEEPSTGDQTSGAIFDTAAYHQPLAHPAKKNSSWLWIIGVIGLLLLGAAGGAALYFLGIV